MQVHADISTGKVTRVTLGNHEIRLERGWWCLDGQRGMSYDRAVEALYYAAHNDDERCGCSLCERWREENA